MDSEFSSYTTTETIISHEGEGPEPSDGTSLISEAPEALKEFNRVKSQTAEVLLGEAYVALTNVVTPKFRRDVAESIEEFLDFSTRKVWDETEK